VFRAAVQQRHDLSAVFAAEDIYGCDQWGRLIPDDSALFELDGPSQFGVVKSTVRLVVRSSVDVTTGYFVQVKKPRILQGQRQACATTLTEAVLAGAVQVPVVSEAGFRGGDQVLFSAEGVRLMSRVRAVAPGQLTFYDDVVPEVDLAAGTGVTACSFYRVIHRTSPGDRAPIQELILQEIVGTGGLV
jgi:hypothetical protein